MELLGIDPVRAAGDIAKGLVGLALAPLGQTAVLRRERRKVWSCPARLHIEAHGVHGTRGKQVAGRIESALENHPGVLWARVNAPSARVIVAVEDPAPPTKDLVELVRRAEAEPATEASGWSRTSCTTRRTASKAPGCCPRSPPTPRDWRWPRSRASPPGRRSRASWAR